MKTCWIIYNGSLTSDKFRDQADLVHEAAVRAGVRSVILKNYEVLMDVTGHFADKPDFVVFLDKDIVLATYLKSHGIPVFNDPDVIERCDNKTKQAVTLAADGVPMPRTILAPKVYPNFTIRDSGFYERVLGEIGLPMIIKEARGSFGMNVYLIETENAFYDKVDSLRGKEYLFQEFVASSRGRDIRVNVVGGRVAAAMARSSETDFRANITNGGVASVVDLTPEQEAVALQAARSVGADFAGVDLLYGPGGQPLVCEVNGAAHIRNIYNVTGINVADAMISYILEGLS
ncbi:hypothetical protein NCCP2716_13000 [Sporosarcina sp. NCCP-2716]|uniref:ATP-grasp domain-containing protein n=1 Tax=Sporosarcina sp. NCCP-2716 TaxID=2943679 RepID=UPI00203F8C8D|nr:RimK family alpha-L-glutamate ligase [Sporosarcina sp. NCCP-2716]GKV68802.1 hypothetical protein NCCP2716_13000 [Sporosarcina sp. NCCP-2716]